MNKMKSYIIECFKKQYGFAPTKKAIIPMEGSGSDDNMDWLAFCINGIGYDCHVGGKVYRNESYDYEI